MKKTFILLCISLFSIGLAKEVTAESNDIGYYKLYNGFKFVSNIGYNPFSKDDVKSSFFNHEPYVQYTFLEDFLESKYQYLSESLKSDDIVNQQEYKDNNQRTALWVGAGYKIK